MVIDPLTAGLFGAQTLLGGKSAKKAKKAANAQQAALAALFAKAGQDQDRLYGSAMGEVGKYGGVAKQQAAFMGKQSEASGLQSLATSGLSNTTIAPQFKAAVKQGTAQNLAKIDEDIGLMKASLLTGLAGAKAGLVGAQAGGIMGFQNQATQPNFAPWAWMFQGKGNTSWGPPPGGGF